MKLQLPQVLQCVVLGNSAVSLPVGAEVLDGGSASTESVLAVASQLASFDSPASEALLLVVFILIILAVIAHKPKLP